MTAQVRFYNPREASPEVLEAMLVGREVIVQEILDDLARQASSASRQHWLIRGPRGIGKTHLVAILYHRVHASPSLDQAYLPVWLPEAEAYSVYSAGILLLQIAQQLAVELQSGKDSGSADLEKKIEQIESGGDDPALFEEMAELLRQEAEKRGKILLVLMENLDALLTGFPARRSAQEAQRLRSLLSQNREILFLSTTPTRYLAELSDPRKPLYGQLKERSLLPLTEEEVGQLLQGLTRVTSLNPAEIILDQNQQGRLRRRVLHRLTGGNPRALVMAFSVLSGTPGVRGMVEEMSALLDVQTAYFEARLAKLAPRERAIVTAMALSRENLTLQEIARLTRLPFRSLSTQVERLIEQGYVGSADGEGGKGAIYELSDGLFRLWYQYRKGRKILEPVIRFLALWHPADELEKSLSELRSTSPASPSLLERDLFQMTALQIEKALAFARSRQGQQDREKLWQECAAELVKAEGSDFIHDAKQFQQIIEEGEPGPSVAGSLLALVKELRGKISQLSLSPLTTARYLALIGFALLVAGQPSDATDLLQEGLPYVQQAEDKDAKPIRWVIKTVLARSLSAANRDIEALRQLKETLGDEIYAPNILQQTFAFVILNSDPKNLDEIANVYRDFRKALPPASSGSNTGEVHAALLKAQSLSWFHRLQEGNTTEAEVYITDWMESLARQPEGYLDAFRVALPFLTAAYPLLTTRKWLNVLETSQVREVLETAKIYRLVVEALGAIEPTSVTRHQKTTARIRRALARVPPELRQSVKEAVDEIQKVRETQERPDTGNQPLQET
jgi:DNA polymerase III delta prime subunit